MTARPFLMLMVDHLMVSKHAVCVHVRVPLGGIRHDMAFARDVGADDRHQRADRGPVHMPATGRPAALYKGQDNIAEA